MSYTIERLDKPSAFIVTFNEDFDFYDDVINFHAELASALDQENSLFAVVVDTSKISFNVGEFMGAIQAALKTERNPNTHPNTKHLIIVTTNKMVRVSVDGFKKFGLANTIYIANDREHAIRIAYGNHSDAETA